MTQEEKRIKLSDVGGLIDPQRILYYQAPQGGGLEDVCSKVPHAYRSRPAFDWKPVPNYFGDLNAVRGLEENLTDDQWTDYINNLYFITFKPAAKDRDRQAINASAEQKCEALGKTLGLW